MHEGIEELLEDHLEQSHQQMDRMHQRLVRLGFGMKRAMTISRLIAMEINSHLKEVRENVRAERKRSSSRLQKVWYMARKKVKDECRARNLEAEIEMVKDKAIVTDIEQPGDTV
jgi:hypothetical protein